MSKDRWIKTADEFYDGTNRVRDTLFERNRTEYDLIVAEIFSDEAQPLHSYFMKACTIVYAFRLSRLFNAYILKLLLLSHHCLAASWLDKKTNRRNLQLCLLK